MLVLALTDGTNVAYSFLDMEDLVGGYTGASPINVSGTTISHDNSGVTADSYGDSSNQTPDFGDTFNALRATVDAKGHVTAMSQHTVKIPDTLATTNSPGLMSAADKTKLDGSTSKTTWWGSSNTSASTAAKVVTCSDFTLVEGAIISVQFLNGNTASAPTLNVNSTGAKAIYVGNLAANDTTNVLKWSNFTTVTFIYNGTDWRYLTSSSAGSATPSRGAGTWYGSSTTGASSDAKTATIANFVLTKGAMVAITFSYGNTSDTLSLDINGTGAKTVYKGITAVSANHPLKWVGGETLTFIYDGEYYRYISSSQNTVNAYGDLLGETLTNASIANSGWREAGNFTLPTGIWLVNVAVQFQSNSTGNRQLSLNTATASAGALLFTRRQLAANSITTDMGVMGVVQGGRTWYINVSQNSGSTLTVTSRYSAVRLGNEVNQLPVT